MRFLIIVGNGMGAAALFFIQDNMTLFFIVSLLTIASIGIGLSLPCLDALITDGIEKKERGTITSFYSSMRFLGVAAGPPLTAVLLKAVPESMYMVFAGLSLLSALYTLWAIKPEKKEKKALAGV